MILFLISCVGTTKILQSKDTLDASIESFLNLKVCTLVTIILMFTYQYHTFYKIYPLAFKDENMNSYRRYLLFKRAISLEFHSFYDNIPDEEKVR